MPRPKEAQDDELNIDETVDSLVQDVFPGDHDDDPSDSRQRKAAGGDDLDPENPDVEEEEDELELGDEDETGTEGAEKAAADAAAASTESGEETVEIPQSVPAELKEKWSSVPQEFREWYAKREKDFLDGTQQYRQAAEWGQQLHEVIHPYMPYISGKRYADGRPVPPQDAIAFLLNAEYQLSSGTPQQKAAMLARLAQDYQIDLSLMPEPGAQIPPELQPLANQVNQLSNTLNTWQQSQLAAAKEKARLEVEAFASDKENHPYFEEVSEDIAKFIGMGLDLKTAYDRAVWANPITRAKEQGRLDKARVAEAARKAKEEKERRLRARAPNIRATPTNRRPTAKVGSIDDTLRETLRDINSRT